ncbi:MAG: FKBP-type peptidyl-prolyl cis-trans isomerase [Microbacterium sp.]|uniref:FKBP-type peptidyl-prolyl cis-trans isomerase n=1 Tax=Microbacterium sp. TaxID=51671 RepID=UPI0039E29891
MRKIPAILTVLGVAALSLTGCGSVGASACARPAAPTDGLTSQVEATGAMGTEPSVAISAPLHVDTASTWDAVEGEGTPITADDQLVVLDIALYDGTSGEKLVATSFDGDMSRVFAMQQWIETFPDLGELLECATEGSRVYVTLPPGGVEEQAAASLQLDATSSAVLVVDVGKVYLPRATGAAVFNDARNMPTVVRAPDGQPGIIVPDADPPTDIVVQTLVRGDGEKLKDGDGARIHYTGLPWERGASVLATSWGTSPVTAPVGAASLPGFQEALAGQTVGSQVLVVVPADQVTADSVPNAPSGKALVYVIDILGIDAPTTTATQ